MSLQIVPLTDAQVQRMSEKPKLTAGHYRGVVVHQKLKVDAEGFPILSKRPRTEGCPELLLTIKPLANPDDYGTEVDVPVFQTLALPLATIRADGSTVELAKTVASECNGPLSVFAADLPRFYDNSTAEAKTQGIRATEQLAIDLAQGTKSLVGKAAYFTAEKNGEYTNYRRFRSILKEGETLVAPENMVE